MYQFVLILIWLGLMYYVTSKKNVRQYEEINEKIVRRYRIGFSVFVFVPIILMVGLRPLTIGDTWGYYSSFRAMPTSIFKLPAFLGTVAKDKGFTVLSAIIKMFVGGNYTFYFLIIAILQAGCLILIYRKYSINYLFSIALFVLSTDYICWMFNGMRQFLAVAVVFGATTLMLKKKYGALLFVIIIASTFHQSALLMILFVLIAQGKAWNKWTIFFITAAIIAVVFVGEFTGFLDTALADTQYKNVVSDFQSFDDDGTNPIRVLIYSIPTVLAFVRRDVIRRTDDKMIHFCTNMSIISSALYVVSMFTSGIYIGRLPIYASLYNYILLPWEIEHFFTRSSRRIVYIALLGGYLGYYFLQLLQWGFI